MGALSLTIICAGSLEPCTGLEFSKKMPPGSMVTSGDAELDE